MRYIYIGLTVAVFSACGGTAKASEIDSQSEVRSRERLTQQFEQDLGNSDEPVEPIFEDTDDEILTPDESSDLNDESSEPSPTNDSEASQIYSIEIRTFFPSTSLAFPPDEQERLRSLYEGQVLTSAQINQIADEVTQWYLNQGYLTSRAEPHLEPGGTLVILVIEGALGDILIEGSDRLQSYIEQRINLGASTPLSYEELEEQLRLLRDDPLFESVEASLRAQEEGRSSLYVRVQEADPWEFQVSIDNYSPASVGSERLGVSLSYQNLTGTGDRLSAVYTRTTTGGAESLELNYQIPVNPMNGTVQLRGLFDRTRVTQAPFDELNIEGESQLYSLQFRQPLIRTTREELALSIGFDYKDGQSFIFDRIPTPFGIGPDAEGNSRTSVIRFGQDYIRRDLQGAWGARSQFSFGVDLFDATVNPDPIPDSRFFSWLFQAQRFQRLGSDVVLLVQAETQLTPDSLLASEQFSIGGGQSLRGYQQNARTGDNGVRLSAESRIAIQRNSAGFPTLQLAPFMDAGTVWNDPNNPNKLTEQAFLVGVGLGLIWEPLSGLDLRLDAALPLVGISDDGDNLQDAGIYFSVDFEL